MIIGKYVTSEKRVFSNFCMEIDWTIGDCIAIKIYGFVAYLTSPIQPHKIQLTISQSAQRVRLLIGSSLDKSFLFDNLGSDVVWVDCGAEEGSINREVRRRQKPVFERRCVHCTLTHSLTQANILGPPQV